MGRRRRHVLAEPTCLVKEHWFLLAEDVLLDALKRARKGELVTSQAGITTFTITVQEDD
jgi:hypothetical protein